MLAALSGVTSTTILEIEKTRTDPQLSTIVRLAHAFGFDVHVALRPRR
jgi:DNA-binding XRE family transcriptional regulator